tara:strand:+ start:335 stop:478 length:144 start_codon:yes stop_codon:yes gene_type:complete
MCISRRGSEKQQNFTRGKVSAHESEYWGKERRERSRILNAGDVRRKE